jgi:hypothetical protein
MTLLHKIAGTIETLRNNINAGLDHNTFNRSKAILRDGKIDLELDICCNRHTLRYLNGEAENDVHYDKKSFIVEGFIYKKGTFENFGNNCGIKPNGSPEYLDRLIGKWMCKGWYINRGLDTKTGNYIDSTHTYELDTKTALSRILMSNGKEKIDMQDPFDRVLCPGLGAYSKVRGGSVIQTNVGINNTEAYNFIFKFRFRY